MSVKEIIIKETTIEQHNYEDGQLPPHESKFLTTLFLKKNPKIVFEIGTFFGHTTKLLAELLPNSTIHTIDLPDDFREEDGTPKSDYHLIKRRTIGREFQNLECASRIIQHYGDTANWDFNNVGIPDAFFIDGSHTYEYCKNDSEKCLELCKNKPALFVWHDYAVIHPGVVNFINEWSNSGKDINKVAGTSLAFWFKKK
jgi:hypothetical protein